MDGTKILTDSEVRGLLRPAEAVRLMSEAMVADHLGTLTAPARTWVELESARFAFTAGAFDRSVSGFRVYGGWGPGSDQLTAVWGPDGRLRAVVLGDVLGSARTGALGGAAVDKLARPDSTTIAVIGSGTVAWWQLWAALAVRTATDVRVYSRNEDRRAAYAARARDELRVRARAVGSAQAAVEGADVVIVSTDARSPVIDADWISPGAHVTSTGPKLATGAEIPLQLVERAAVMASDSPQQAHADRAPWFSDRPLDHLGAVIADDRPGRQAPDDITLYCSTGLAGTEVLLADSLLRRA